MSAAGVAAAGLALAACAREPSVSQAAEAAEAGAWTLTREATVTLSGGDSFGGLSGLRVDGDLLIAVTDTGHWTTIDPAAGTASDIRPLGGVPTDAPKSTRDAEALARAANGDWLVAFEGRHRIATYDDLAGPPTATATLPGTDDLPANGSLESLTVLPDGRLLVLAETAEADGSHKAWIGRGDEWEQRRYRTSGGFVPVDAATLPGGDVLVLERRFSILGWFESRLSLLEASEIAGEDALIAEAIGSIAPEEGTENFEGLAVTPGDDGAILVYAVSDDNFMNLQRTLLVRYRLEWAEPLSDIQYPSSF
ncbi:esterase-like activity of phytase family protein [Inquilinus sp. CAU 1745]|uniref:esterase-like activity of phytase family protein n=1 Tax=Inquilinus sp. CAU 1745 TaxID=3140369 RepID=UPI00325B7A05